MRNKTRITRSRARDAVLRCAPDLSEVTLARNPQRFALVIPEPRKIQEAMFDWLTRRLFQLPVLTPESGYTEVRKLSVEEISAVSRALNAYVARRRRAEAKVRG